MKPIFARNPAEWRAWLRKNGKHAHEVWLIFYKKMFGKSGVDFSQALDEALCFGWVDTKVKSLDAERYMQRFAPRQPGSTWSSSNILRAKQLIARRKMTSAGRAAFRGHRARKAQPLPMQLPKDLERRFRKNRAAWKAFQEFPPGYRKMTIGWVASAKQEQTRLTRLSKLVDFSSRNERIEFI